MKSISIVIPAYNEEKAIESALAKISGYLERKKYDYEIIAVDDGSVDNTLKIAQKFASPKIRILKNEVNRGKGYSVKRGMLAARGEWILFTDADLSTPIEELENFLKHQDYDVIIGSRALKDSKILVRQPRFREIGGKAINFFVQALALPGIKDTQCGFKLFRREAALKIFPKQTIDRWGFDIEVLFIARKFGFKIKELPVRWFNSPQSKVSPFRDGVRILGDIVKIKFNGWRGTYKD